MWTSPSADCKRCKPSRASIAPARKFDTMVLDFANDADTIEKSFQTYYKTTLLAKETDPNRLNDLLSDIEDFHLYTNEEVEQLALLYWDENADRARIDGLLDTMRQRFVNINDEDRQAQCKGAMKSLCAHL